MTRLLRIIHRQSGVEGLSSCLTDNEWEGAASWLHLMMGLRALRPFGDFVTLLAAKTLIMQLADVLRSQMCRVYK